MASGVQLLPPGPPTVQKSAGLPSRLIADVVAGKLDVRDVPLPDLDAADEPGDLDDLERGLSGPEEETDD